MYSSWQKALTYFRYYLKASNGKGHGTHSPFIYHFIREVLNDNKHYSEYDKVEDLRESLLKNNTAFYIEDLGAGSSKPASSTRTIASIVKNAAKPPKQGQLLFRIVKNYQPSTILELGTSLGLTTAYLSLGNPDAKVASIEGAKEVGNQARLNIENLGLKNISVIDGNFDEKLSSVMDGISKIDLAFIDGNHRQEPTIRYFEDISRKIHNDSILVFDDIHWSREMEEAWKIISSSEKVRCSIDLFSLGILLFRQEFIEKQDFTIRF